VSERKRGREEERQRKKERERESDILLFAVYKFYKLTNKRQIHCKLYLHICPNLLIVNCNYFLFHRRGTTYGRRKIKL